MRILKAVALGACVLLVAASTASAEVQLTIQDGRVTLVAKDATVRQILTEWARIGQTKIVNVERIPGGPVTLQLTNVPEAEALDILLRSVSGYMVAPRPDAVANLSRYDRIMVMPTAAAPRAASAAPAPVFQPPPVLPQPTVDDDEDGPTPGVVVPARGPIFQTVQPPQLVNPQQGAAPDPVQQQLLPVSGGFGFGPQPFVQSPAVPATGQPSVAAPYPGASGTAGTPRPGMVVQPQVQPGQVQPRQAAPASQRSP